MAEKPTYKELEKRIQEFKLSEKALLESENKLKIHIQNTPVGVTSWDLDFKAVEWNPAAEVIFGYTEAEALGKHATELILPEDMKGLAGDIFNDLISQKGGVHSTNENITKEGKRIICDWYNTTLKDVDGNVVGMGSLVQDVTDRKRMEKAWRENEELLNKTGDMAKVGGWQLDLETQKVIWTQTTCRIHELPDDFVPALDEAIKFYHPDDREAVTKFINQAIKAGKSFDFEARLITANGKQRWVRALGQPTMKAGKCVRLSGTFQDITERKQAEEQLLQKEETLKVITESTNDTIIIMNNRGIITFWNSAASNMLGYSKEEALGENLHEFIVPERFLNAHLSAFPQFIKTGKGSAVGTTLELYAIGKDRIEIPVELSLSSIMIEGEWFAVGIMRDNTERKKMEEELRQLATIDSLTNINNRRYFLDLALKEMDRSKRYGHPFSLIMLDIDHFKKVNDTYGHSVGDQVLIDFCDTCMKELRKSDFMGRLGGEEFAVAILECDLEGAAILAERIRETAASHTVVIGNEEIRFTVSIGITQMWQDSDLNSMVESADNALYKAKENGRNQVQFAEIKPV